MWPANYAKIQCHTHEIAIRIKPEFCDSLSSLNPKEVRFPMPCYILFGRMAVPCHDLQTWVRWLQTHAAETRVGLDQIGALTVSTQFIGLVAPGTEESPALYSAIVSGRGGRPLTVAYVASWDEAERTHAELCAVARQAYRRRLTNI
jgi:hypothetical protein